MEAAEVVVATTVCRNDLREAGSAVGTEKSCGDDRVLKPEAPLAREAKQISVVAPFMVFLAWFVSKCGTTTEYPILNPMTKISKIGCRPMMTWVATGYPHKV